MHAEIMSVDEIFERFEIEFDAGAEPVFHGGELVTGSLRVNLKKQITINAIRLQFKGRSSWLVPESKHSSHDDKEKVYFDKDFVLLERPPGHPEPGHFPWNANFTYSLPFECPLPKGCPSSYESPNACIRYFARCTIETDEQTRFLVKKAFTVVAPPELRQLLPPAEEAISRQDVASFGGCCCRSKVRAEISLPKRAYAPGEVVVGTMSIDSRNSKNLSEHIEVRLVDSAKRAIEISSPINAKLIESTTTADGITTTESTIEDPSRNGVVATVSSVKTDKKAKKEKKATKKRVVKKYQTTDAPLVPQHHKSKHSESQQRVLFARSVAPEDIAQSKVSAFKSEVRLLTIPPLPTSIYPDNAELDVNDQLNLLTNAAVTDGRLSKLLESPSTATLRQRRQPFIHVDYALQVAIGSHLVIEVPIDIHPIPIYANGIDFRPFAAGAQPIGEPDEAGCQPFHGPFTFTPLYPTYLEPPKPVKILQSNTVTEKVPTAISVAGDSETPQVTKSIEQTTVQHPDGSIIVVEKRHQTITATTNIVTTTPHVKHDTQPVKELEHSAIEITVNKTSSQHVEKVREAPVVQENTIEPVHQEPAHEEPSHQQQPHEAQEAGPSEVEEVEEIHQNACQPQDDSNNIEPVVEVSDSETPQAHVKEKQQNGIDSFNGFVEEEHKSNGFHHEKTENDVNVTEQTETAEEQLPNGHVVQTTTTTRTTASKNGKIVETNVEEVEYDENGVEVNKQNRTTTSEQQPAMVMQDGIITAE